MVDLGFLDKLLGKKGAPVGAAEKDPVCGMTVEPGKAAATASHGGRTYHFCAPGCKARFEADPHRFLGAHGH